MLQCIMGLKLHKLHRYYYVTNYVQSIYQPGVNENAELCCYDCTKIEAFQNHGQNKPFTSEYVFSNYLLENTVEWD